ncbi:response regulator transcription factor [Bacteroidales bacterium OttesenSCG-928-L03]|nr:response regulator transcription factor [Bacteroidales bacterium OttesenSCG-928-L03]
MGNKILLIEDDLMLAKALERFFRKESFQVTVAGDAESALNEYKNSDYDLILSDVALPGKSGLEFVEDIRKTNTIVPIILMSGTEISVPSQIEGYSLGIVNYLTKPVEPNILLAQIKSLLGADKQLNIKIGDYTVSLDGQFLTIDEQIIKLREKDSQVLTCLLKKINQSIKKEEITKQVWKGNDMKLNNLLDQSIYRLRNIMKPYSQIVIDTTYGLGYSLTSQKKR